MDCKRCEELISGSDEWNPTEAKDSEVIRCEDCGRVYVKSGNMIMEAKSCGGNCNCSC